VSQSDIIAIRRADPQGTDWQNVLELVLAAFAYMEDRIDPASSAHRLTVDAMRTQSEDGIVLLAEAGAALVGCVFLTRRPDEMYLVKLAVETGRQGQGIGRQLFEVAADAARAEGCREIELQARDELTENHVIFAAMGFRETGWITHAGYDRLTSVTMRCVL
tara:strand:- start:2846 stop:3331 length:486 start_codon:yes stop_codon:yes gene_type:complete